MAIAHVLKAGSSETVVAGQSLTRQAGGAITKIDTFTSGGYDSTTGQFSAPPSRTQAFAYDGNARLTRETTTQGGTSTSTETGYEYDAVGNRTRKTHTTAAGAEITTYVYDAADRVTRETTSLPGGGSRTTTYSWDGNGNLQSKTEPGKTTLYRFDPQNRLIDIRTGATQAEAQAATPSVSYAYDAQGNRVRKATSQGTTGYLIDTTHPYAQVAAQTRGNEAMAYTWGAQLLRQTKVNATASEDILPLAGHLGTSLGAIDIAGNVVERVNADAFGNAEQSSGLKQGHIYTGEYWDQDAQLLYLRARWYDPRVGRFISGDPFEGRQRDPRSLNRYVYAHSEPVGGRDPSGRMSTGEQSMTMSTLATLATRAAVGAGIGGVLNAADAYLAGDNVGEAAVQGIVLGALIGPLTGVQALRPLLAAAATAGGAMGLYDAYARDNGELLAFRGVLFVAGPAFFVRGLSRPSTVTENTTVYRAFDPRTGDVIYVGITDDLAARAATHLRQRGFQIREMPGLTDMPRAAARNVEQALIEFYGLGRNGGSLLNKINSIAVRRADYSQRVMDGFSRLKSAGYPEGNGWW